MYADPFIASEMGYRAAEDRRAWLEQRIYQQLRADYIEAVLKNPGERMPTPAFRNRDYKASDLVADYEGAGPDICRLLQACDKCADPAVRLLAQAILSKAADEYARTHAEASL